MSDPTQPIGGSRLLGGRYRLGESLGRGGMAVVWRAEDELLGRSVAVKTLDLTGPDSETAAARFQREARATAALNHPNIVTVFDTGSEGDTAYLVMELLPGQTLSDELRERGPFPVTEVRSIGEQVCAALAAAHAAGIVHRDIKPGNIARTADGSIKVLDFGITQFLDDVLGGGQQLTMTNTVMGTAAYLAPEQAQGGRVDERADLYALGCVLMALLTGEPPFEGATPVATLLMHTQEPPPDVRERRPEVPAAMAVLVADLLVKDPAQRPASAAAVGERIRHLESAPTVATQVLPAAAPPPPTGPTRPVAPPPGPIPPEPMEEERRRSWAWVPWLLLVLLLAGGGILLLTQGDDTPDPAPTVPVSTPATSEQSTPTTSEPEPTPTTSEEAPPTTSEAPQTSQTPPETTSEAPSTSAEPEPEPTPSPEEPTQSMESAASALSRTVQATLGKEGRKALQGPLEDLDDAVKDRDAEAASEAVSDVRSAYDEAVEDEVITGPAATAVGGLIKGVEDAISG